MKLVLLLGIAVAITAAAPRDWSRTVVNTAIGWRTGQAAAPLKLVEYASLNCSHCAHFSQAADEQIMAQVKTGRVQFEYRPYLIFPHDVAATLVVRCIPTSHRFAFIQDYYRNSEAITERLRGAMADATRRAALDAAKVQGVGAFNRQVVAVTGMGTLAARHGLTPVAANRCVADPAGLSWLQKTQAAAKAAGVSGTPTYRLNGQPLNVRSPEQLLAALK
ncbi:thioredoxin domain-containing protein [uncultured Sphingomonas sp.]|uniref:DsbA family protein n=1 Tax=uncultured Sphingomonas sp. TaxID=158754 RepID=UPI0025DBF380|nr:thioredoxin domain-containing protein [uncultured Sphingomonas sp.]